MSVSDHDHSLPEAPSTLLLLFPRQADTESERLSCWEPWGTSADACPVPVVKAGQQKRLLLFSLPLLQNPSPGLFAVKHPLTYVETLIDYHLCSHPKYKFTKECHYGSSIPITQKQFLHHTVKPWSQAQRQNWPWAAGTGGWGTRKWGVTAGTGNKRVCSHGCRTRIVTMARGPWHAPALERGRWVHHTTPSACAPSQASRFPLSTFLFFSFEGYA